MNDKKDIINLLWNLLVALLFLLLIFKFSDGLKKIDKIENSLDILAHKINDIDNYCKHHQKLDSLGIKYSVDTSKVIMQIDSIKIYNNWDWESIISGDSVGTPAGMTE